MFKVHITFKDDVVKDYTCCSLIVDDRGVALLTTDEVFEIFSFGDIYFTSIEEVEKSEI